MNIHEAIEKYIFNRSKKFSANSLKAYSYALKRFARFVGEAKQLARISEEEIDRFQAELKGKYKVNTQGEVRQYFPWTRRFKDSPVSRW